MLQCKSAAFHLFHLHLDVRWWILSLLYQLEEILGTHMKLPFEHDLSSNKNLNNLESNGGSENVSQHTLFDTVINVMIWDVITLLERESAQVRY